MLRAQMSFGAGVCLILHHEWAVRHDYLANNGSTKYLAAACVVACMLKYILTPMKLKWLEVND